MARPPRPSGQPEPIDSDELFDPVQRVMHGVLRTYFDASLGETNRIEAVIDRIVIEQAIHRRRKAVLLCAASVGLVLGLASVWHASPRPAGAPTPVNVNEARHDQGPAGVTKIRLAAAERRRLPLDNGGTLLVQGPAELDLLDGTHARLHLGRIRVRVGEPGPTGFVVETPQGTVTDRGTEFGVEAGSDSTTAVVVFEGRVDVAARTVDGSAGPPVQELLQGEGVTVDSTGKLNRLMSIVLNDGDPIFQRPGEAVTGGSNRVIADVWDNVRVAESRQFYEIVPGGLREDAGSYVDRRAHEWNGMTERGMPPYLVGADYVKTFNRDKARRNVEFYVRVTRPCRLFVFLDKRVSPPPDWLPESFRDTGDLIGNDNGPLHEVRKVYDVEHDIGPGRSIDNPHCVWEQVVRRPGVITLGPNAGDSRKSEMYGVAAVALDAESNVSTRPTTGPGVRDRS